METSSFSSCTNVNSANDNVETTTCPLKSSAMMCKSHLQYDQHSSEEELEVINGPISVAAAEAASASGAATLGVRDTSSLISERGSSSLDLHGDTMTMKRSSSTMIENRKRSLAHSSDDDLRNFLEPILTPVNFRTSPPIEAFKPNRSHMYRSTTPLILQEARCGIENIHLCDNSVNNKNDANNKDANNDNNDYNNDDNDNDDNDNDNDLCTTIRRKLIKDNDPNDPNATAKILSGGGAITKGTSNNSNSNINSNSNSNSSSIMQMKISNSISSHHIYQPQAKHTFQFNSSRSSPASTTGLDAEVRSVSPPAKLFHCAISPRRRPIRTQHNSQRLQRPHRPCLDFDKMQQVSL